uniref:Apple domain-containing protein n=1 Tax=Panagrellus redivivus TaxID=6233 RepID=A0A7E4W5B7_PANRE
MQVYSNMYAKAALFLLFCSTVCSDLTYIQLYGYAVIGDTDYVYNTTKPQECADACYDYDGCIAFRMIGNTGQCCFYSTVQSVRSGRLEAWVRLRPQPRISDRRGRNQHNPHRRDASGRTAWELPATTKDRHTWPKISSTIRMMPST